MPTPSLLIVPARFKSGKLYSQIPTSGAGDFTVTRATTATRVNASGLIESVASGIPRLDYATSGGTVGCPALLVEPSAQNLAFHSETWTSGSNWNLNNNVTRATGSTNNFLAPDGTLTANAISPTSVNNIHYLFSNNSPNITFTSGTIYTMSAFFKAGGTNLPVSGSAGRYVQMNFVAARFTQGGYANFDLQNGVVTASGGTTDANRSARIQNYGNGWYRCSFTATCNVDGGGVGVVALLITASGAPIYQIFSGTVTDVLYGWGAQLETGSVATSYIPTTTAAVTRNADVVTNTVASSLIGQTEGTLYAEFFVDFNNRNADILNINDGSSNNGFFMSIRSSTVVQLIVRRAASNALIFQRAGAYPIGVNKLAIAYKNGDFAICLNGTTVQTDTSSITMPSVSINRVSLGQGFLYTLDQQLRILDAELYTTRLTNAELAALTSL